MKRGERDPTRVNGQRTQAGVVRLVLGTKVRPVTTVKARSARVSCCAVGYFLFRRSSWTSSFKNSSSARLPANSAAIRDRKPSSFHFIPIGALWRSISQLQAVRPVTALECCDVVVRLL